ncbi:MAG: Antibiotic biosynthesis monooxygenase, partial [Actinomycetota bacterium]
MSKVAVAVKLRIKAGQRDAFTEAVKPGLATAQSEPGTQTYIFHHDAVDADVVWFYELYANQDAM